MRALSSRETGPSAAVDLPAAASAGASDGVLGAVWTLTGCEDLNANLLRFPAGRGVAAHVNREVDVVLVGVSGSGAVRVGEREHALGPGTLVPVPKGERREVRSGSDDFAYLSLHRRRPGVRIEPRDERRDAGLRSAP